MQRVWKPKDTPGKKWKRRRNTIKRFVLEKINELHMAAWDTFFPRHYSFAQISRNFFGIDAHRRKRNQRILRRTVSSTLSRLKRNGLVARKTTKGKTVWRITAEGRQWLEEMEDSFELPPEDGVTRLVIFDIPEKQRRKRGKLRAELLACDFLPLQKSVWAGTRPLPAHFISLLDDLELEGKVHIFSVQKEGTLEDIE